MDTFRKWWNKPKADDKSVLARFYYADRALTAVASELDSFDGRAEPERCSRLVARLRQGQDQVLSITNIIMDELLGEDRTPRAFRAKFPEEVLQESLAGQLWFGAECLAAGSSIMNREVESAAMRPLAKAVTKSLDNVRNLLREQCLHIKTPNSLTLNLDFNDTITETLCESLKIFDRLFAEFELLYVSAMVQVKSKQEHEMQEFICVLFSETLQDALKVGLLEQEQVDYFDPALMFSIPRLAIVAGLIVYKHGPLNMSMPADQLSEMFRPFRTLLIKIRDLLRTLNANELYQLEKLLCTNEEIHLQNNFNCDDKINSDDELVSNVICDCCANKDNVSSFYPVNEALVPNGWEEDTDKELNDNLLTGDCASGYLIPNTNFGNLLQTNEAPLTDSFISSDDEFNSKKDNTLHNGNNSVTTDDIHKNSIKKDGDSGIGTENTSLDRTPEEENSSSLADHTTSEENSVLSGKYTENWERLRKTKPSCSQNAVKKTTITITPIDNPSTSQHIIRIRDKRDKTKSRKSHSSSHTVKVHSKKKYKASQDTSGEDTSSSLSEGDLQEVNLALRAAVRMKFKSTENLLHRLFVCIAGVADQLQTNFASDLRQILRSVFLMNTTPQKEEITIQQKSKDTDFFEFRASENDVIQENAGSNQSIYSAEEVSPESDTVFSSSRHERSASLETDVRVIRNVERSRSLGEDSDSREENPRQFSDNKRSNSVRDSFAKDLPGTRSGSNSSISSAADNSPISRSRTSHENSFNCTNSRRTTETPPRWIPDDEAPRCMSCALAFTTFRRRHHCRNCGGIFCGVCSNTTAPLPKFGLNKAVRVCKECFVREVGT